MMNFWLLFGIARNKSAEKDLEEEEEQVNF